MKKVNIAPVSHLNTIKGGNTTLTEQTIVLECVSEVTAINSTCVSSIDIQCKTGTSRGSGSI
ncbi:MAG: hypothetical protein AAF617_13500 [Bacteroidota bacterium]